MFKSARGNKFAPKNISNSDKIKWKFLQWFKNCFSFSKKNIIIQITDFLPSWWSLQCIWLNLTYLGRWQMKNVKVIQHTIMNNVLSRCSVLFCEETLVFTTFLSLSVILSILLESSHWFSWFCSNMRLVEAL